MGAEKYADKALSPAKKRGFLFVVLWLDLLITLREDFMTPKEIVLSGYKSFAEGDMVSLGKIYHKDALIKVNGNHELSG